MNHSSFALCIHQFKCHIFYCCLHVQNAWADTTFDTRNVAVHPLVVEVTDVQDTRPYFLRAPPVTRLPETAKEVRMFYRRHL